MTIGEIVTGFLEQKKNEVRTSYEAKGRSASGAAGRSLTVNVSEQPNKIVGEITGSHYWYYIENGRRPGKRPPIASIEKWIDDRRLTLNGISKQSLAFLIARKIGREGTKGTPILESVFTPQSLQELAQSIGSAYLSTVKSDILKKIQ